MTQNEFEILETFLQYGDLQKSKLIFVNLEEELMREDGITPERVRKEIQEKADAEVARRARTNAGALPAGRASGAGSITLTQDEINIAKKMGIPLSDYAKAYKLGSRDLREGVSVDEQE